MGNTNDPGELRLSGENAIGTAGGILTINNPLNLGATHSTIFRGGTVRINGLVSGTGTSGVSLSTGGTFSGDLAQAR